MKNWNKQLGEETPCVNKKKVLNLERENSSSVESLKEIEGNKLGNKGLNNNNKQKSNGWMVKRIEDHRDWEKCESNLLPNSESEKEMEVKDSYKKRKSKKKKVKRRLAKDLPPVLVPTKRPLPKLAAVDEEIEQSLEI